ncbi:MAG: AI-2E family transporter, partial [Xanthomonadales bacterium]|nr:AI-2E family transporter [Xanthomonadales bacterium]
MSSQPEQATVSQWESRRWFWLAISLIAIWLVWKLAPVIMPFALSAALAYLFDPLTDRLERVRIGRWHWGRTFAVILVFMLMIGVFVVMLLVLIPMLQTQVQQLVAKSPEFLDWLGGTAWPWVQRNLGLEGVTLDTGTLTESLKQYWREASQALVSVIGTLSQGGQKVFSFLINLLLVPVVTFYLLRDWDKLIEGIRGMLPRRHEPLVSRLAG